jgi:hypothetical protein
MKTIATGLAKALIAAMKFTPMSAGQIAREAIRHPKHRRGFHELRLDPNVKVLRAFWCDERPGWGPRHILEMNARNGVGSSKIRKAHAK